jgi:predicted RNase H-like HicB family nuclease
MNKNLNVMKNSKKMTVTAVIDDHTQLVTAFFNDLPAVVVQGVSIDDVRVKLTSLLQSFIKRLQSQSTDFEIQTKSIA